METDHETTLALLEALLNQGEAIRELKLELESLKNMFFEHKPPFREAFAGHRAKLLSGDALRRVDEQLAALRAAVEALRTQG
jgi:hypothetical protein